MNAYLEKLSSSALSSSCLVPVACLHLYYLRTFKYYINGDEEKHFRTEHCLIIGTRGVSCLFEQYNIYNTKFIYIVGDTNSITLAMIEQI